MENYNKLLEKAQKAYKNCVTGAEKRRLESIFPELKMSEDERIRKEIIEFLQLPHRQFVGERNQEEWIEWLQKQGEKTLTVDVNSMVEAYRQRHLNQGITFKNSPVTNMCVNMCVAAYKRGIENTLDKLYLKQDEHNPAWSKEDEKIMKQIDSLLYCQCTIHSSMYEKLHNWLKSLEPQPQWKPTVDQMQSLYSVVITYSKKDDYKLTYDSLNSLYDDLKKL